MAREKRPMDKLTKKLTRQEILEHADELDARRREQIQNQVKIINRLTDLNMHYESVLAGIAEGVLDGSPAVAQEALDKAAEINKKHRKQENKND
jgi:hypothetical protein